MARRLLASEITANGQWVVDDAQLRREISAAEEPLRAAAEAVKPHHKGLYTEFIQKAGQEGITAGAAYAISLLEQLAQLNRTSLPERTLQGTLFTPYVHSEHNAVNFRGESNYSLQRPKYATAAAVIATSKNLTKSQLGKELPEATTGEPQTLITKFEKAGLIIKLPTQVAPYVYETDTIVHTQEFDRRMEELPEWQRAVKLRTLAHGLGKTELEMFDALLEWGALLCTGSEIA